MTAASAAAQPSRRGLGSAFARLWSASIVSNLADGIGKTAIPLIATTLTRDPFLIAVLTALSYVPWLAFGILSGVVVDRSDRRRTMGVANIVRMAAAAVIAATALTGTLSIGVLLVVALVIGVGETFYDNSVLAMVPSVVPRSGLDRANGRMQTSDQVVQMFIATPIAGFLFAIAAALPMATTAAGYLVGGVLALMLPVVAGRAHRQDAVTAPTTERTSVRADIAEVARYLLHHRMLRSVVLFTSFLGGLSAFAQAGVVLYVIQTLGVPAAAFGVITAAIGVGAALGALSASRVVERFGRGRVMLATTVIDGVGILGVGLFPTVWVAVPFYALSAAAIGVWNVPWGALRQQLTPGPLLGRMIGVIRTLTWGIMPVATLLGGLVGRIDLRLPFIIGGALTLVVSLLGARLLLRVPDAPGDQPHEASGGGASGPAAPPPDVPPSAAGTA